MRNFILGFALVSMLCGQSDAAYTGINQTHVTPLPTVTGSTVTYSLVGTPSGPPTYLWEMKNPVFGSSCTPPWIVVASGMGASSVTLTHATPGTYQIRCTITWSGGSPPSTPGQQTLPTSITIPEPSSFNTTYGPDVPTNIGTAITFQFRICCGSTPSQNNSGTAQEYISNRKYYDHWTTPGTPTIVALPDMGWVPVAPSPTFFLTGPVIMDSKSGGYQNWSTMPVGWVFYSSTQRLRLTQSDSCGNLKYFDLGTIDLKCKKVSSTQYVWER